jgi:hypothetical protein
VARHDQELPLRSSPPGRPAHQVLAPISESVVTPTTKRSRSRSFLGADVPGRMRPRRLSSSERQKRRGQAPRALGRSTVSTEVGTCLSVRRPLVAGMLMLDGRGLAVSAAAFLPDDVARTFLEQLRWPGGPVWPALSLRWSRARRQPRWTLAGARTG